MIDFFEASDLIGLRAFRALNDVELYLITFFKAFVSFTLNRTVMNEYVCSAIAAEKAVAFCIVEPLYGALILCQWSDSLASHVCHLLQRIAEWKSLSDNTAYEV